MAGRDVLIGLTLLFVPSLAAQDQPQLVWEGQVDGISLLRVRGRGIKAQAKEGLPAGQQRFHFYQRLPENRLQVRLEVVEGRGHVQILEQPRADNEYTLTVSVEDRQPGSSFYKLAFFWESERRAPSPPTQPPLGRRESVAWSGRVQGEVIVSCRGDFCAAETIHGTVTGDRFRFSQPLPGRELPVSLEKTEGRGDIRLLDQPRESNGYAARVLIRDPQAGASDYRFSLAWARPSQKDTEFDFARLGMIWSGRVDGRVRVIVKGHAAMSEVIGGGRLTGERAQFTRGLPTAGNPKPTVRKLRGRGGVVLVESPSQANHWQLIFEIDDGESGADDYEVEVRW